jgi:hypothetical protein
MDWYRAIRRLSGERKILFATDLIESEGYTRLLGADDQVAPLHNIDGWLFRKQSFLGSVWRNAVKAMFGPWQARLVRKLATREPNAVFHAHTMYYMVLCWLAGIRFIGTPQGSEILVRPFRSRVYRYFATRALLAAEHVLIDSVNMQRSIEQLCGRKSQVVQFGIDTSEILRIADSGMPRETILSIRGLCPIYRIDALLEARKRTRGQPPLTLIYPFSEAGYKYAVSRQLQPGDADVGRLAKPEMYPLLAKTLLVISIPSSDSSPRSVYEAIFAGCCVAASYSPWIDGLPACMKDRLFMVDLEDPLWLEKAITHARVVTKENFCPSEEALERFDQQRTMRRMAEEYY